MPDSPVINKRVTRKCIDAAHPPKCYTRVRKKIGTKEMVFDSDARRVYIGGLGGGYV